MKIYEYQAKQLFEKYGIAVPKGSIARTSREAVLAAQSIATTPVVLKAQVYAGGRGKAGGIRIARNLDDAESLSAGLLGRRLVTAQTGPEGKPVNTLLVEEQLAVRKEIYLGIAIDRAKRCPVVLASSEGGVEIEKLAAEEPRKIVTEYVDPACGLRPFQASRLFFSLGLAPHLVNKAAPILLGLWRLFVENDCANAEINPLVLTDSLDFVALDGKVTIDDNALFRHPELASLHDASQENPLEAEASKLGLNYIKLTGNVGCMVNGAGLAMATMDLIKIAGADPANFLDVGGGATATMIREGLGIILSDHDVRILFVNIFGGILRCDTLATGLAEGAKRLDIRVPMIVRLEGTNKDIGQRILASSGLNLVSVSGLREAAEKLKTEVKKMRS
ncbi:MAG: Succinyl-CoA ligase (ADP-forming) subunit beta [Syntrophorhabdaceae bacterium PtaU1.Bin034]|jgi:succinyl-CoA synthetase beta subunit|nr:MAG: Succinyl-CoA ligase (ADP-forming) subunit beta [Syntrophorhabdaceae bacterium PtaU1.Bin034]